MILLNARRLFPALLLAAVLSAPGVDAQVTPTHTPAPTSSFTPTYTPDLVHQCCNASATIGAGQLNQPVGISIGATTLYVADSMNSRIARFSIPSGAPLTPLTGSGGMATLVRPVDVANLGGDLFVTDGWDDWSTIKRVYRLDIASDTIAATVIEGNAKMLGVDADASGDVYVSFMETKEGPHSVRKFREVPPGSGTYAQVAVLPYFAEPNDVWVSDDGVTMIVADTQNYQIRRFVETSPDSYRDDGVMVLDGSDIPGRVAWPFQVSWASGPFSPPGGLFYVTDISRRFQVFDAAWRFRYFCKPVDSAINNIVGIAADPASGDVYAGLGGPDVVQRVSACALLPGPATATPTSTMPPAPAGCDAPNADYFVFPNPVRESAMKVRFLACYPGAVEIQVYNTASDIVMKQTLVGVPGSNTVSLDVSRLAMGIYYCRLELPGAAGGRGKQRFTRFAVVR